MRPLFLVLVIWGAACGPGPQAVRPTPAPASDSIAERAAPRPSADWAIDGDHVGDLALDRPIPAALLRGADVAARYQVRYVGDAQPFEGLRFDAPPITAAIAGGPFARQVEAEGAAEPNADAHRGAALAAIQAGAKVRALHVRGPGPRTRAGIEVGSPLSALRAAYPDLSLHPVPPLWGKDECVATTAALPVVRFLFPSCKAAEAGAPVARIDLAR